MAEFKKLSEVEQLTTAPEAATVLIEDGGEIKRVPKKEVGGAGIKTVIIKDSEYNNALAGVQSALARPEITYECINMTFEEAYQTMASGEPLSVLGIITYDGAPMNLYGVITFCGDAMFGIPCLSPVFDVFNLQLFWTVDGLSTTAPETNN